MAILERLFLVIVAAALGVLGMIRWFEPEKPTGPVFTTQPPVTEAKTPEGALPGKVPGTPLQIQALVQYEGPYWEDGTGEYVANVAAILLSNPGEEGIHYAQISLCIDGSLYEFEFTYLPAGGRLLVPEKNRKPYFLGKVTDCRCIELVLGDFTAARQEIRVTQNGMAGVILENLTAQKLENVRLYYKLYLMDEDVYIGGTTYQMEAGELGIGGVCEVIPENFVWGYSAIVDVCTGEDR